MQTNLCLSGVADCYGAAEYPAVVNEAVSRIQKWRPDAVTVNEACRRDAIQIARRTGYHVRFVLVVYAEEPFPCIDPGGRGLFGHALLTKSPITGSESQVFTAQGSLEDRRWLCATTRMGTDVCTAHLETQHTSAAEAASDAQCAELAEVLAARESRILVFGGDLNRRESCAPPGTWRRTDASAQQAPGIQHVYGSVALRSPVTQVLPSAFSDHDVLVVRAVGAGDLRTDGERGEHLASLVVGIHVTDCDRWEATCQAM